MSVEAHRSVNGDTGESPEEAALARVLESYLAGLEAGRPAEPDRLIAAHPELAGPLRACLKVMHLAAGLSGSSGAPAAGPGGDEIAAPPGVSALTVLWPHDSSAPHRLLPEPPEDGPPVARVGNDVLPDSPDGVGAGRYQILGEIARGGMGVVLKARDVDLGRDLALKVLQSRHRGDPDIAGRFVEEARIGGQLQHPGIVPVHELGMLAGRRPYFTMKLVKGRTLAALLAERPGPEADLPRFLTIFEQVCQTVAYAHARRVIHRDLKPANVMVGSFGEVHVVDWGLAKVLPEGGVADEIRALEREETVVQTARSGPPGSGGESQPGSVLGTPSYMAPEQARGDLDRVDERADVFGLGAILCEILAGRPPFTGATRDEIRAQAARADLADALGRLDACGADAELIALARDCLAAEPGHRPRDAGEVALRVSAYRSGVQERLRAAELARVAAQARADEERKRRRVTVALAASILALFVLGGGGWAYLARQRAARLLATNRVVTAALAEAERLRGQAQLADLDVSKWSAAVSAAAQARDLLAQGEPDANLRSRVTAVLADLEAARAEAEEQAAELERDRALLAELESIRASRIEHEGGRGTDAEYAAAFRRFGIDLDQLDPAEAGRRIARRSAPVELASFLDDWAFVRSLPDAPKDEARWRRLLKAAQVADPHPWRTTVRDKIARRDLTPLRQLADDTRTIEAQTPQSLLLLSHALKAQGERDQAERILRKAWQMAPGDFWINLKLASIEWDERNSRFVRPGEAARFLSAAVALRSRSPVVRTSLGLALSEEGRTEEAIAEYREAIRLKADAVNAHKNLGIALADQGRLDEAISVYQEGLRLNPDRAAASSLHTNLGSILCNRGRLEEAVAECREAIRLDPDHANAHNNLGHALLQQGKLNEAIAEFELVLRRRPDHATAHRNLGTALNRKGELDAGIAEYREAIRLYPEYADAHKDLGLALQIQGRLGEAVAEIREALRIKPDLPDGHNVLGVALAVQGKSDEAVAEFREALRLNPKNSLAHSNLGGLLRERGDLDGAVAECREALRLDPTSPVAHTNLGNVLAAQRKLDDAVAEYREAIRLKPDEALAHNNLGTALGDRGMSEEAIAALREAIRLKPSLAEAHDNLGNALQGRGRLEEAIVEFREAIRLKPDLAGAHVNLGEVLRRRGRLEEAIAEHREALRLRPDYFEAHSNLGVALHDQRKFAEAAAEFRQALRLKPESADTHGKLGVILYEQGKLDAGLDELRAAIRIRPAFADAHSNLGLILAKMGRVDEAIAEFREAIRIRPDNVYYINLADTRFMRGEFDMVIAESRELLRGDPNSAIGHCNLGRALLQKGSYGDALAELRRGHELGSKQPGWPLPSAQWVREAGRMAGLERKLPDFLSGKARPADPAESLVLAQMYYQKKLHGASARFWEEAFRARPALADDMQAQHRYNAACAAALAGCGQGKDDPPPDEAAKARWRKQALGWLRADEKVWSKILEAGPPQARPIIAQTLQHWKADPDLAGLRDPGPLATLPTDEQDACRALWKDVDALLVKTAGNAP